MAHLSGWCTGPPGARPQHEKCRALVCGCGCHGSAETPAVERDSRRETWENEASPTGVLAHSNRALTASLATKGGGW